jgi:hypothetical protein
MANPTEETALAEYLCERVRDRASGRSENECLRNYPHDVYFVGNLRSRPEDNDEQEQDAGHLRELINKLAPVAFGAEFRFQPESDEVEITVKVKWACYYRVFPTLEQQRSHQQQTEESEEEADTVEADNNSRETEIADAVPAASNSQSTIEQEEPSEEDSTIEAEREQEERLAESESPEVTESQRDRRRGRTPRDRLFIRFRKIDCQAGGVVTLRRNAAGEWSADESNSNLKAALDEETRRVQEVALNDPERLHTAGATDAQVNVPETALVSEADYNAFLQSLQTDVVPEWRWEVSSEVRPNDDTDLTDQVVSIEFVNASSRQAPPPPAPDNPNIDAFLFDARTLFQFKNATVLPFELELAPRGFRYDRDLWGRGFNCAVERPEEWVDTLPNTFRTTHTPIYKQKRYQTKEQPKPYFRNLAQNPLLILEAIYSAMEDYLQQWDEERRNYINKEPNWEAEFGSEFDRDRQQFEQEISRFRRGYELIRDNQDVQLAFKLTNETFYRLGNNPQKPKDKWRLFQIVFLVTQIPGIAALADPNSPDASEREMVDIIYFPTGGGKTEAYLGTIVFHCFFDRLRGKTAGVTAWTRFPLRLLTLQQTQRMADVISIADLKG